MPFVEYVFPVLGRQGDADVRIDNSGMSESSYGWRKWLWDTFPSANVVTQSNPAVVWLPPGARWKCNYGIPWGFDPNGVRYRYIVWMCPDEDNKPEFFSTDRMPYKMVDHWDREGKWTVNGVRPAGAGAGAGLPYGPTPYDRNTPDQSPTMVFTGSANQHRDPNTGQFVTTPGTPPAYGDGGRYAPCGPYHLAAVDDDGTIIEYLGGGDSRLDPPNGTKNGTDTVAWDTWFPGPRENPNNRPAGAVYWTDETGLASTMKQENYGAGGFSAGASFAQGQHGTGPFRLAFVNLIFNGSNAAWTNTTFNFPNTFPNANEGQTLFSLLNTDDCYVYGCEFYNSRGDLADFSARRCWVENCIFRQGGRNCFTIRRYFGVMLKNIVAERCYSQIGDNEPFGNIPPMDPAPGWAWGPKTVADTLYVIGFIFGDGDGQQCFYFDSKAGGNFSRIWMQDMFSRPSDIDPTNPGPTKVRKMVGSALSGPLVMGPDTGDVGAGLVNDEAGGRGQVIIINAKFGNAGRSQRFGNFRFCRDFRLKDVEAYVEEDGIKLTGNAQNWGHVRTDFWDYADETRRKTVWNVNPNIVNIQKEPGNPTHGDAFWAAQTGYADDPPTPVFPGEWYWAQTAALPVDPSPPDLPPAAPASLLATPLQKGVRLTWPAVAAADLRDYTLQRFTIAGWVTLAVVAAGGIRRYDDMNFTSVSTRTYRVFATDQADQDSTATQTTGAPTGPFVTPSTVWKGRVG